MNQFSQYRHRKVCRCNWWIRKHVWIFGNVWNLLTWHIRFNWTTPRIENECICLNVCTMKMENKKKRMKIRSCVHRKFSFIQASISCHLAVSCHWKENWNECYMWVSEWYEQTVFDVSQTENIHGVWNHYAIMFWVFVHTSRISKPCIKQPNVNDSFHYERRVWNRRFQADRWIATQRVWKNKFDRI